MADYALQPQPASPTVTNSRARHAEGAIWALLLLVAVGPFLLDSGGPDARLAGDGNLLRQALYPALLVYLAVTQGVLSEPHRLKVLPRGLLLLLALCLTSVLWAIDPSIALRRFALMAIVVLTVFLAVSGAGTSRTLAALRYGLALILVLNYLTVIASPVGVHGLGGPEPALVGNWRGLMIHKNTAAIACAFTILIWLFTTKGWLLRWPVIVGAAYFLLQTQSKTSMGALAVALLFGAAFKLMPRWTRPVAIGSGIVLLALGVVAGQDYLGEASQYLSQPDALTGRGQIWRIMLSYASANPLLGAGYGSFWDIGPASPVYAYTRGWISTISHGHNGYLDMLVQIGVPGLILGIVALIVAPAWKLLTSDSIAPTYGAFLAASLAFYVVRDITETSLLSGDKVSWVLMLFVVALIGAAGRRGQNTLAVGRARDERTAPTGEMSRDRA